ncbi:hypothetical protein IJG14_00215 [bacterium]|nr:hypothetical protein [bacterium]
MTITLFENSYVTLDFADDYFLNRPNSESWNDLSQIKKEQALIFATMKVNNFNFIGEKKVLSQTLEFPRNFYPELPKDIQFAVCEEAFAIIENSVHSKNKKLGISSVSLGNSSVSYFNKYNTGILLSQDAFTFVSKWTAKNFDIT